MIFFFFGDVPLLFFLFCYFVNLFVYFLHVTIVSVVILSVQMRDIICKCVVLKNIFKWQYLVPFIIIVVILFIELFCITPLFISFYNPIINIIIFRSLQRPPVIHLKDMAYHLYLLVFFHRTRDNGSYNVVLFQTIIFATFIKRFTYISDLAGLFIYPSIGLIFILLLHFPDWKPRKPEETEKGKARGNPASQSRDIFIIKTPMGNVKIKSIYVLLCFLSKNILIHYIYIATYLAILTNLNLEDYVYVLYYLEPAEINLHYSGYNYLVDFICRTEEMIRNAFSGTQNVVLSFDTVACIVSSRRTHTFFFYQIAIIVSGSFTVIHSFTTITWLTSYQILFWITPKKV
eukprot:gene7866-5493_t